MKGARRKSQRIRNEELTAHVKLRFEQRFDMCANRKVRLEILKMIWNRQSILIEKQTNSRAVHRVMIDGKLIDVVYDKRRRVLVTCLFPDTPQSEGEQCL